MNPLFVTVTQQTVVNGVVLGLVYAILAAGFVLIYRSTGVLNFAQGEIGAFGVAIFTLLAAGFGVPYWPAFVLAVASACLVGLVIETTVVRRLSSASKLVLLIGTIGVAQLLVVARVSLPERGASKAFPMPFDLRWQFGDVQIVGRDVLILIVAPLTILALALFLTRTRWGLMVRASAGNPDTARVFGISVKRTSTIVWMIAAGFAAVTAILIAPIQGITPGSIVGSGAAALGPGLMVRALVVALIARLSSLPMTLVGGLLVGVAESIARASVDSRNGAIVDVWLLLAAIVLVLFWVRGRGGDNSFALAVKLQSVPERLRRVWYVRHANLFGFALLFALLAVVPFVFSSPGDTVAWTDVLVFAMMALPLSMLTGWAGQFTLGQFAFVGLGAGVMVMTTHGTSFPFLPNFGLALPWWQAAAFATAIGGVAALLIGVSALRVKGLFLAVITLAFAVASSTWIFRQAWFTGSEFENKTPYMEGPRLGGIDLASGRAFYFLCLATLAVLVGILIRIRRSGIGRSMIAVSDNEEMAAAATVSPTRMKLMAFGIAGAMASLAGCFFVTLRVQITPSSTFDPDGSVLLVSTAIIGGIGSVAGPIVGALFTRGLPALFGDVQEVQLLTSGIGLLVLLMYFPGGLMQIVHGIRSLVLGAAERRLDREDAEEVVAAPVQVVEHQRIAAPAPDEPWLAVRDLSVRFGGNQAVDRVSLEVWPGELVGLIGTNGAGKSTLMNAISGFVPSTGGVQVLGQDVSRLAPHRRHRVGLGRGFQAARLYPNLSVRETVLVALEARERTDLLTAVTGLPPAPGRERRKRTAADDLIGFLGLGRYADELTCNLSTGTRRIVELACLLAADAKVLMLDEPTGGVAQKETEAFGPLLRRIQQELGAAMVVIEHDMPLVMSISDRIYCLEAGKVIACGDPETIRNTPAVIASYLGTDERAIQRSDTGVTAAMTT
ncbi:ABC transporter permease subunit [Nocardioides marmoriginsengisoli]|uniref:ABC transporter permease subunit n=1 Tax=Nocardioides marmoriginsengisoli TaxID=661483 RepID=UPI00161E4019|nr:ATP-binding cassette domain-containing protein [Nocardioides marmoriginsengisoli]